MTEARDEPHLPEEPYATSILDPMTGAFTPALWCEKCGRATEAYAVGTSSGVYRHVDAALNPAVADDVLPDTDVLPADPPPALPEDDEPLVEEEV